MLKRLGILEWNLEGNFADVRLTNCHSIFFQLDFFFSKLCNYISILWLSLVNYKHDVTLVECNLSYSASLSILPARIRIPPDSPVYTRIPATRTMVPRLFGRNRMKTITRETSFQLLFSLEIALWRGKIWWRSRRLPCVGKISPYCLTFWRNVIKVSRVMQDSRLLFSFRVF